MSNRTSNRTNHQVSRKLSRRVPNWDVELALWARDVSGQPFEWGQTDCASLVLSAIRRTTGVQRFPTLPTWTTRTGALRAFKKTGSPTAALEGIGAVRVERAWCQTGDILVIPDDDGTGLPQLAVHVAGQAVTSTEEHGVRRAPLGKVPEGATVLRIP